MYGKESLHMNKKRFDREICITLLYEKHLELAANGENRYPRRSDFSEEQVVAIKAYLGPWPRALEAAQIKPPQCKAKRKEKTS